MRLFGVIGYPLNHTKSPDFFKNYFREMEITDAEYQAFPLSDITTIRTWARQFPDLRGFNVTIPHKQSIIPWLDVCTHDANIGAVNTVKIEGEKWIGHNTDIVGFERSLPYTNLENIRALVFGNGGAARAVEYVLKKLGAQVLIVSRSGTQDSITYSAIDHERIMNAHWLINTTPLGMEPDMNAVPIPYEAVHHGHFCYDLVYKPALTTFLSLCLRQGATVQNGLKMLQLQALASWNFWNNSN